MTPLQWNLIIDQINACKAELKHHLKPHTRKLWEDRLEAWNELLNQLEDTTMTNIIHFPTRKRDEARINDACMSMNNLAWEVENLTKTPAHIISEASFNNVPAWHELSRLSNLLMRVADHVRKYEAFVASEVARENKQAAKPSLDTVQEW